MKVEDVLIDKGIGYIPSGKDVVVKCLNPEHEDRSPSLRIDKLTGMMHCFSCGFAGNLFHHFNLVVNLTDADIIRLKEKIRSLSKDKLVIPVSAEPYTKSYRGIAAATLRDFEAFTLMNKDFEGRIVFPIRDIQEDIVCFIGRYINSKVDPKYIVKPEDTKLPLFPAKPEIIQNSIILVEGIFDAINLHDKGLPNAVCTFGTSFGSVKKYKKVQKNIERLNMYKLQGVTKIFIMYDGDKAGREAAKQLNSNLEKHFVSEIINLPEGMDPGSLNREEVAALKELVYG
jgi:DNA primase